MARSVAVFGIAFLLVGCTAGSSSLAGPPGVHAASVAGVAGSTNLFNASFGRHDLKGWTGVKNGWHTSNGIVTFDGTGQGAVLAPFVTTGLTDFAIQASMQAVGTAQQPTSGWGIEVRGAWPRRGIAAGSFFSADPTFNEPQLMWRNESVGGDDVAFQPGFNTYRLDVHGKDYTLSIDGHRITQFTIPDFAKGTRVGLLAWNRTIQVKRFTVKRLKHVKPLRAQPPVKDLSLSGAKVPATLQPSLGHYFTNEELARRTNSSVSTLASAGDVLSYGISFAAATRPDFGASSMSSMSRALTSSQEAQNALATEWAALQKSVAGNTNYRSEDLTDLGDEGHVVSYDYFAGSYDATVVSLLFRRGPYEISITQNFVQGGGMALDDMIRATEDLARAIDTRARSLG